MCIEITNKILITSLKRYDDWWTLILQDRGVENITDFRTKHMHNLLKMISWCDIQSQDSYWDWSIQKKKSLLLCIPVHDLICIVRQTAELSLKIPNDIFLEELLLILMFPIIIDFISHFYLICHFHLVSTPTKWLFISSSFCYPL